MENEDIQSDSDLPIERPVKRTLNSGRRSLRSGKRELSSGDEEATSETSALDAKDLTLGAEDLTLKSDKLALKSDQLTLKQGERYGDLRVVRCVSSSLLANYYHMQHVRDLHDVTVCVFHERTMQDPKCLKRLEALKASVAHVDHVGVPRISECAVIGGRHCLVMEPVEGQSLSQYFAEASQDGVCGVGVHDATRITALLLGLLGYAHARGLDHRDLDTDLILVQADGTLRILGVGVKAALGVDCFESIVSASVSPLDASQDAARLNSFDVMSPEYRGGVPEDARVDIYAVGCIAYWLLTGVKVNASSYKKPSLIVEELSNSWNELVEVAIQRDCDERYQSCKMVLIALKATEQITEIEGHGLIQRQIDCIPVPSGILQRGATVARIYRLSMIGLIGLVLTAFAASFLKKAYIEEDVLVPSVVALAGDGEVANFSLNVKPVTSTVRIVGVSDEFVTSTGEMSFVMPAGRYVLTVSAPRYVGERLAITVDEAERLSMELELKPVLIDLEIQTVPGAVIVMVDGTGHEVELGVADTTGLFELKQLAVLENSRLRVQQVGYLPQLVETFESGSIEVPLAELPASVSILTQPAGARVLINDVDMGVSPLTVDELEGNGDYAIAVNHSGYRSMTRSVHVESGEREVVDFGVLTPNFAGLEVQATFVGAEDGQTSSLLEAVEVELDGQRLALDSKELDTVSEGNHAVRLVHPDYSSQVQMVSVVDGADQTLVFNMYPLPGQVELVLPDGLDAGVRLNGKVVEFRDGVVSVPANQDVHFDLWIMDHLTMVREFKLKPNERVVWDVSPVPIPAPELGVAWNVPYLGMEFVWVAPGSYAMGSPLQEAGRLPNEGPLTRVRFSRGFWAGAYEVTQAQYARVMDQNPSLAAGEQFPVDRVSWEDALLYCVMLTNLEKVAGRLPVGYAYRLPTEAEWEYLARSGAQTAFSFGEVADYSNGNFCGVYPADVTSGQERGRMDHYGSRAVGAYEPNDNGLYDIHGNVAEWTLDRYNARLPGDPLLDPKPRGDGRLVVVRGGSWEDFAVRARSAVRVGLRPEIKSNAIGFRVVLAPEL